MSWKYEQQYRLPSWNYSDSGYYFVTICVKDRINCFGQINNEQMKLSAVGKIALRFWKVVPKSFENVKIDEFIIMPNHVHGILIIDDDRRNAP